MLVYLARRVLHMVPVFLGITLLTFGLVSWSGDPLERGGEVTLGDRRVLQPGEVRRVQEALGYDLPPLLNLDVKDQRRYVQASAEAVLETWPGLAAELRARARATAEATGWPVDGAAAWPDEVVGATRDRLERLPHGRLAREDLPVVDAPFRVRRELVSRTGDLVPRLLEFAGDLDRLARLGAQTPLHVVPVLESEAAQGADPEEGRAFLLAAAGASVGARFTAVGEIRAWVAGHREAWSDDAVARTSGAWLDAATALVAARASAVAPKELEAAQAHVEKAARALGMLGGLALPEFMPRLLAAGPQVKALASDLLRDHAARDEAYEVFWASGAEPTAEQRRLQELQDGRLSRWWGRQRIHHVEVGPAARWGWYSWTRTRYARWLGSVLTLDFGLSLDHDRPVRDLLLDRLPVTLLLQGAAIALMYLLAVPLGVAAAVRRGGLFDRGVMLAAFGLYAAPGFWLATMAILWLGGTFPMQGLHDPAVARALFEGRLSAWSWTALGDLLWHMVLPVAILAHAGIAVLSRYGRAGMLEVLRQDYVRTARAKGLPERTVLFKHALRNAVLPLITLLGGLFPVLVGGSVVVELIFGIPGMGLLAWDAALSQDVPVVMAVVTLSALVTMVGYVVTDLLYAVADPRIRHG